MDARVLVPHPPTRSRDTIGNICFTKPLLGELGNQRVIVVTSGWHAARVRYLTQVIWGPGYRVAVDSLADQASTRPPEETARREAGLLCHGAGSPPSAQAMTPRLLASWPRDHPVYADRRQTTLAELAAMVARHPPDRD
jgi:hypothetical protein